MDVKLTPRDRAVQLGKEAHLLLLNGLLLQALEQPGDAGCGGGAPGHSRMALIVQLVPGEFGELGHAAMDKLLEMEAAGGPECPLIAYTGIGIGYGESLPEDSPERTMYPVDGLIVAKELPLSRIFQARLLSEWWETHPMAGPPDGSTTIEGNIPPKPQLRICNWVGDIPVVMPEASMKFTAGSDAADEWQKRVQDFVARHGSVARVVVQASGPDFTSEGLSRPVDPAILVDVPPREGSELVPVARMTARFDPVEVFLEKDTGDLYLAPMADAGEAEFEVGPCELFGFGLGTFQATDLNGARKASLPCLLDDDCALVMPLPEGNGGNTKSVVPLATALFQYERHTGVSNVAVQGHTVGPNGNFFHRYTVAPGSEHYIMEPKEVEIPTADGGGSCLQHGRASSGPCSWLVALLSPLAL